MSSWRRTWVGLALVAIAGCSGGGDSSSSTSGSTASGSTDSSSSSASASSASSGGTTSNNGSGSNGGSATATNGSSSTGGATTSTNGSSSTGGSASASNGSSSTGGSASASNGSSSTGGSSTGTTGFQSTLLVQNDGDTPPNNDPADSTSLPLFQAWVGSFAAPYSLYQVPEDGSDLLSPTSAMLAPVSTVVWFTGDNYGSPDGTLDTDQETTLLSWLDSGDKTLLIFSTGLITDLGNNRPYDGTDGPETDPLISLLAVQDNSYPEFYPGPDDIEGGLNAEDSVVVTGGADSAFAGKGWTVVNGYAFDQYGGDGVNFEWNGLAPASGADILATVQADANLTFSSNQTMPVVLGRKHVGAAGTSTVVLVVFPAENISNGISGANGNSLQEFFAAVQAYAGL